MRSTRHLAVGAVSAVVLALLAGAAAGCSDAKPAASKQDPKAPLEIWIRQAPDGESAKTAKRLADEFTAKSGIQTKVVAIFDGFETKLQQQAAQKDLPDIVINDTAQIGTMQSQGWLRQVDRGKTAGAGDLSDRSWKATQGADGKYWAVPFSAQAFAMFIRADWRKKLNLPEPKSWDDIVALATAFKQQDPDGNGKADTHGMVIPGGTTRGYMSWYFSSFLWANGGDFLSSAGNGKWKPAINNDKSTEAAAWLRDLFCGKKVVNPDAVSNDTTRSHEVFEKGLGGIYLTGPYMLARFVKNMGADKLEVVPVPNGPSGGPGTLAEGENVYLMAGSPNEAGQQKFAEFAAGVDGQKVGMNGDKDGAIVRLPVSSKVEMAAERKDPRWKVFADAYEKAGVYTPNVPSWTPFRQMSADTLNAVAANCGLNLKQELDKLAGKFSEELKKQNAFG